MWSQVELAFAAGTLPPVTELDALLQRPAADDVDARLHEASVAGLRESRLAAQPSADSRHR